MASGRITWNHFTESGPEYWSDEERGDHMLNYPNKAVNKLNDEHVAAIWKIIQREIHKLTYPQG